MPPPTGKVTHVIFDFDGLLVETESMYSTANQMMLARYGKEFTLDIKRGMMGKKHLEAIEWLINKLEIGDQVTVEEYAKDYDAWLDRQYLEAIAMPGARRLVEHLADHDIPMAICTGSCSRTFALKNTSVTEWTSLIPIQVYTGDDPNVKHGKPHPEPYLYTMNRFIPPPPSPANVLVFEDAPNGVESALAAGMQVVNVPQLEYFNPDDNFRSRVNACLNSLEDFVPEDFGLPPYTLY